MRAWHAIQASLPGKKWGSGARKQQMHQQLEFGSVDSKQQHQSVLFVIQHSIRNLLGATWIQKTRVFSACSNKSGLNETLGNSEKEYQVKGTQGNSKKLKGL